MNTPGKYKVVADMPIDIYDTNDDPTTSSGKFHTNDTFDVYQILPIDVKGREWGLITPIDRVNKNYVILSVNNIANAVRFHDLI